MGIQPELFEDGVSTVKTMKSQTEFPISVMIFAVLMSPGMFLSSSILSSKIHTFPLINLLPRGNMVQIFFNICIISSTVDQKV